MLYMDLKIIYLTEIENEVNKKTIDICKNILFTKLKLRIFMRCPFCGTDDTQVKDSRGSEDGASIRRRRLCSSCGSRFTTFERIQLRELVVVKKW